MQKWVDVCVEVLYFLNLFTVDDIEKMPDDSICQRIWRQNRKKNSTHCETRNKTKTDLTGKWIQFLYLYIYIYVEKAHIPDILLAIFDGFLTSIHIEDLCVDFVFKHKTDLNCSHSY